ncbi:MAG: type II secretion system protein [Sulfurovaceae bacterium]|nr:type II secretion system protein [Sulfurovaceae bacterium]
MKKNFRKGIAMIELIFALVIMGIVLLSAPMLIQQSIRSSNIALQQEAISALATHLEMILTMNWDDKLDNNKTILDTNETSPFNFPPAGLMPSNKIAGRSTKVGVDILTPSISLGKDSGETTFSDFNDIDDFNNENFGLMLFNNETTTADVGDYVDKDVNISTVVTYNKDINPLNALNTPTINLGNIITQVSPTTPTNIKFITVNLTSDSGIKELEKNITLKAFSCNIGIFNIEGKGL